MVGCFGVENIWLDPVLRNKKGVAYLDDNRSKPGNIELAKCSAVI
jgi:hypothetical protein